MSFDAAKYLAGATSRAKSDVANKLVSMYLHELSRRLATQLNVLVSDPAYTSCAYCGRALELDRVAIEHLDGMNRYRIGLHIAGNVVVSCKRCNSEKRRDDSLKQLVLAGSGWESFLAHDGKRCPAGCKTCEYWKTVWPDDADRLLKLPAVCNRIREFRARFPQAVAVCELAKRDLSESLGLLYRECQEFATDKIATAVGEALARILSDMRS
jgi:hypothetical protein